MRRILFLPVILIMALTSAFPESGKIITKSPIVILTFDDAVISQYKTVAPLLKKYHFGATFFICEFPLKKSVDSIQYMNWNQIKKLYQMGFEIGNHTGHHKNVTKLDKNQIMNELIFIEDKCKVNGIPKPASFAYPGNRTDSLSQVVLKEMGYRFARAGGSRCYNPTTDFSLLIPSYTMGSAQKLQLRTSKALENLKSGQILVLTIHGVPDVLHPAYSTSPDLFIHYLKFMHDHHFKVIALHDLGKIFEHTTNFTLK